MASTTGAVESEIILLPDLAREKNVPEDTLRYWRMRGVGPVSFKIGRRVMYRRSEVDAWFAEQEAATRRGGSAA